MRLELVSIVSSDGIRLPGLLYRPGKDTKKVAIWLHGMGDSGVFYDTKLVNALGDTLAGKGIALLAFNNRGAHNKKSLKLADETLPEEDRRYQGGTYYERIADCVHDIDGAAEFLRRQDFSTFYLLGHSTGANKICSYHAQAKNNVFSKYVLAGPGDDTGLFFHELGQKKFWQALGYAAKYAETESQRTMPKYTGMYPFSTRSAWDILNPDGSYNTFPYYEAVHGRIGKKPLFEEYSRIDRPTLVILGEEDEYTAHVGGPARASKLFIEHTSNAMLKKTDFALVPGANHSFDGLQEAFARQVADWLVHE